MYNILIVEDEKNVAEILKAYLEREGYKVYCRDKGLEALELFSKVDFKLVILDLMLPDIDGEDVCGALRRISDVYIFMLTAKVALSDKIQGLNMGADEYLTKPYSPRELVARVNALFRRVAAERKNIIIVDNGKLKIDKDTRSVKLNGNNVILTPNEFDILYVLAKNKGKALAREQLIEKVFGLDFQGYDRTIDVHIKNIRKKIEEDTKAPKYIITVTKLGYKFGEDL